LVFCAFFASETCHTLLTSLFKKRKRKEKEEEEEEEEETAELDV
jgi:hypothetical protein